MARFLHLTDLHVVEPGARVGGVLDTRGILSRAIDRLIAMRPAIDPLDAVLVTGDISDNGDASSYDFARAELGRLGLPLYVVPGNHDAREPLRAAFADLAEMPASGPIDWTTQVGDTMVIGLDTLIEGESGGRIDPSSLTLLARAIDTAADRPIVVALHHPPLRTGVRFLDVIGLDGASALEAALAKAKGDVTLLAGHIHGAHHARLGRHPVLTAPSVCSAFALDRRPDAPVGFFSGPTGCAILDTSPGGIWSVLPLAPVDGPFPF